MKNWRETMMRRAQMKLKPFCRATPRNESSGDVAELQIYGVIGSLEWADEISASMVREELKHLEGAQRIVLRLNSPGGEVFEGVAIYNALKEFGVPVTVRVNGLAASAASLIAMAGERIEMLEGTFLMIHRAWTYAYGNSEDLIQTSIWLETIDAEIARIYSSRTGMDVDEVKAMMTAETWMNPTQAVEKGFADAAVVAGEQPKAAFDLQVFGYEKVPEGLQGQEPAATDEPDGGSGAQGDNPAEWPVEDALRMQRLEAAKARLKFKGGMTC